MLPPEIDHQLKAFCEGYGLKIDKVYKDYEVRSISIVDDEGYSYQMWLEQTGEGWTVHATDNKRERSEHQASTSGFEVALESAYQDVLGWICGKNHTRTPA